MKKRKIAIVIACALIIAVVFHAPLLRYLGNSLIIDDPLEKKDIIVVLSGSETGERVIKGVELYKKNFSTKIIMIGSKIQWNTYEHKIMKDHAIHLGVPEHAVEAVEQGHSTYAQAKKLAGIMRNEGYKSAIVVTSDYHTKRTKFIFNKLFLPSGLNFIVCPSPSERFKVKEWWKSSDYAKIVFYEYTKLLWYWVRY